MKKLKLVYILALFSLGVFTFSSCKDSDKDPYKGLPLLNNDAASAPIVQQDRVNAAVIDFTNLATSAYSVDISTKGNVASLEVRVAVIRGNFISDTLLVKTLTSFPTTLTLNATEIASAIRRLNLRNARGVSLFNPANPATFRNINSRADFAAGDRVEVITTLIDGEGRRFTQRDFNADLIGNQQGQRVVMNYTTFFSCPFNAAAMAGTYNVTIDAWDGFVVAPRPAITVVAGPGANQFTIRDMFAHGAFEARPAGFYDVVVSVNPVTGQATVAAQRSQNSALFGLTNGFISVDGSGFAFSCTGLVQLSLQHRVTAGTFGGGPYTYAIQRR